MTDSYPPHFFTFWNDATEDGMHYDNTEHKCDWHFTICFYSTDPREVIQGTIQARDALRAAGFGVSGKGFDVASDEPTHTGRAISASYTEREA